MWDWFLPGTTPLIMGCLCGRLEIVKYLVDLKADITTKNKYGTTPFSSAGEHSDIANVIKQKYIENRILVFARDMMCLTMLNMELELALGAPGDDV